MISRMILLLGLLSVAAFLIVRWLAPRAMRKPWQVVLYFACTFAVLGGWWWARSLGHGNGGTIGPLLSMVGISWAVAILVCIVIGLPVAIVGALRRRLVARQAQPVDLERRRFLGGMAVPVAALGAGGGGTLAGISGFELRHEEVRIRGLPPALDGFRIGQITDVHVGDFIDPDHLREAVEAMNAAGCDLQVMTGDLIDDLSQLPETIDAKEANTARHGMVAILGNPEIWRGRQEVLDAYAEAAPRGRLRLLVDENERIEHGGVPLRIVGVDYPMGPRGHRTEPELRNVIMQQSAERAFAGIGEGETLLCLTHHPDFFRIAAARGAALTLAGHTHGGQVAFFGFPLFRFAYEFMLGRYRLGEAHLYVSGGTGHWLPWRMGVPAEVTILTLRAV